MSLVWIIPIVLIGASIGSFLNVCIFRIPEGESLIRPGSHCPQCGVNILPWDNIPVLSYLLLRGRCRSCSGRISLQYLIVELLTPLLLISLFFYFRELPLSTFIQYFIFSSLFTLFLIVIFFIDLNHRIIPDKITYPGMLLGVLHSFLRLEDSRFTDSIFQSSIFQSSVFQSLVGLVGGGGFLYLVMKVGQWVYKKEVMGGGDVKLAAMVGGFLGGSGVALTLFLAFLGGSMVGVGLILLRKMHRSSLIPFGPFIVFGAFLTLFFQEELLTFYSRLFLRLR
ncbi:prepilin peptidase [candidate division TA06 bacterium]|nr:prepilin peptidase [candidate division TA06 bacterium]